MHLMQYPCFPVETYANCKENQNIGMFQSSNTSNMIGCVSQQFVKIFKDQNIPFTNLYKTLYA
jgi:hypothetical protein